MNRKIEHNNEKNQWNLNKSNIVLKIIKKKKTQKNSKIINEYDPNSLKNITFIIKDKNGNEIKPESIALSV